MDCQCRAQDQWASSLSVPSISQLPDITRLFINKSTLSFPNNQIEGAPLLRESRFSRYSVSPPPLCTPSSNPSGKPSFLLSSHLPECEMHAQQMTACWEQVYECLIRATQKGTNQYAVPPQMKEEGRCKNFTGLQLSQNMKMLLLISNYFFKCLKQENNCDFGVLCMALYVIHW